MSSNDLLCVERTCTHSFPSSRLLDLQLRSCASLFTWDGQYNCVGYWYYSDSLIYDAVVIGVTGKIVWFI